MHIKSCARAPKTGYWLAIESYVLELLTSSDAAEFPAHSMIFDTLQPDTLT